MCVAAALASAGCATHAAPATSPSTSHNPAAVRQLQADLSSVFNAPIMARGVWGVDIRSAETGAVVFQHNADRLMMPASNMKILTLAAAAQVLGWDHRFATTLETSAPIENGVLRGDLVIRGSGDPTISTRGDRAKLVFDEWANALRAAGISSIQGRIVGDDQAFDDEGLGPGWAWDYLEAGYASPIGALQYNENVAELTVTPGGVVRRSGSCAPRGRQRAHGGESGSNRAGGGRLGGSVDPSTSAVASIGPSSKSAERSRWARQL